MADWNRRAAELRAGRNSYRKQQKAKGIELGRMDAVLKMADWERKEVQDHYATERQYAEWLGLPIGTQVDMFGDHVPEDDEVRARHWHAAGVTAARVGKPRVLPNDCGPKYGPMWDRGYDGEPFIWDVAKTSIDNANKAAAAAPAGKKAGKPGAAAGKRAPSARAKKVAGMISPPPAQHTGDDTVKAAGVVVTGQSGVEEVDSNLTEDDGFGAAKGGPGFDVVH